MLHFHLGIYISTSLASSKNIEGRWAKVLLLHWKKIDTREKITFLNISPLLEKKIWQSIKKIVRNRRRLKGNILNQCKGYCLI